MIFKFDVNNHYCTDPYRIVIREGYKNIFVCRD